MAPTTEHEGAGLRRAGEGRDPTSARSRGAARGGAAGGVGGRHLRLGPARLPGPERAPEAGTGDGPRNGGEGGRRRRRMAPRTARLLQPPPELPLLRRLPERPAEPLPRVACL